MLMLDRGLGGPAALNGFQIVGQSLCRNDIPQAQPGPVLGRPVIVGHGSLVDHQEAQGIGVVHPGRQGAVVEELQRMPQGLGEFIAPALDGKVSPHSPQHQ